MNKTLIFLFVNSLLDGLIRLPPGNFINRNLNSLPGNEDQADWPRVKIKCA